MPAIRRSQQSPLRTSSLASDGAALQNHVVEWMVIAAALGALFVGVAGSMARAARAPVPHQDAAEEAWGRAASALEGRLDAGHTGTLTPLRLSLIAEVDGARVELATNVPVDPTAGGSSRGVVRFALGTGPRFQLFERAPGDGPGDAALLGPEVVRAGLRLVTDAPDATAAAFDEEARRLAAGLRRRLTFGSDGRGVHAEWDGVEQDPLVLEQVARLLARVALVGVEALRSLAELEDAVLVVDARGPHVEVARGALVLEIRGEVSVGGVAYEVSVAPRRPIPVFDLRIDPEGVAEGDVPSGVIDPEQAPALKEVGEAVLAAHPALVRLRWRGTPDRAQAEAGVRLLVAIAAGTGRRGAFR